MEMDMRAVAMASWFMAPLELGRRVVLGHENGSFIMAVLTRAGGAR